MLSCVQSCAGLHRSYVDDVCGRYSASENDGGKCTHKLINSSLYSLFSASGKSERTKCIEMSLTLMAISSLPTPQCPCAQREILD
jgi:hypothetical protein